MLHYLEFGNYLATHRKNRMARLILLMLVLVVFMPFSSSTPAPDGEGGKCKGKIIRTGPNNYVLRCSPKCEPADDGCDKDSVVVVVMGTPYPADACACEGGDSTGCCTVYLISETSSPYYTVGGDCSAQNTTCPSGDECEEESTTGEYPQLIEAVCLGDA